MGDSYGCALLECTFPIIIEFVVVVGTFVERWLILSGMVVRSEVVLCSVVPRTISNPSRPCQARVFRFLLLAQSVEIGAACELSSVHYEPAIHSLVLRHLEEF